MSEGIVHWSAQLADGDIVQRSNGVMMGDIPPFLGMRYAVQTDVPNIPLVEVAVDPKKGATAHAFTRRLRTVNGPGSTDIVVVRVTPDPQQAALSVSLYITPEGKVLLSPEDLYEF
jgi:hypothetical protein